VDSAAVTWDLATMSWKIDTTTVDSVDHAGEYTLTVTPITPDTATSLTSLVIVYNILEPCDPPQLTWTTTQFTDTVINIMRTHADIAPIVLNT
jgi:hypothetical protein